MKPAAHESMFCRECSVKNTCLNIDRQTHSRLHSRCQWYMFHDTCIVRNKTNSSKYKLIQFNSNLNYIHICNIFYATALLTSACARVFRNDRQTNQREYGTNICTLTSPNRMLSCRLEWPQHFELPINVIYCERKHWHTCTRIHKPT